MTTLELERKKKLLLKDIDSEELYDKVQRYVQRLKKSTSNLPVQFASEKEMNASIDRAEQDIKVGRTTSQSDMEKLMGICK
jgi:DNA replication initiation complex subunit (GINS family)